MVQPLQECHHQATADQVENERHQFVPPPGAVHLLRRERTEARPRRLREQDLGTFRLIVDKLGARAEGEHHKGMQRLEVPCDGKVAVAAALSQRDGHVTCGAAL
eukprot:4088795-Prymnesium_polylepis.1